MSEVSSVLNWYKIAPETKSPVKMVAGRDIMSGEGEGGRLTGLPRDMEWAYGGLDGRSGLELWA